MHTGEVNRVGRPAGNILQICEIFTFISFPIKINDFDISTENSVGTIQSTSISEKIFPSAIILFCIPHHH